MKSVYTTTIRKVLDYVKENSPTTPSKISQDVKINYNGINCSLDFLESLGHIRVTKTNGSTRIVELIKGVKEDGENIPNAPVGLSSSNITRR